MPSATVFCYTNSYQASSSNGGAWSVNGGASNPTVGVFSMKGTTTIYRPCYTWDTTSLDTGTYAGATVSSATLTSLGGGGSSTVHQALSILSSDMTTAVPNAAMGASLGVGNTTKSVTSIVQSWINNTGTAWGFWLKDDATSQYYSAGTNAVSVTFDYAYQAPPTTPGAWTTPAADGTSVAASATFPLAFTASTDPQGDAIQYEISVNQDGAGWLVLEGARKTTNSFTIDTSDWAAGSYQFRVRAIDPAGSNTFSAYGPTRQVNITRSFTVTSQRVDNGAPDAADPAATSTINQKKLTHLSDGSVVAIFAGWTSAPDAQAQLKRRSAGVWSALTNGQINGWSNGSIASYVDAGGTERIVAVWKQYGVSGGRVAGGIYVMTGALDSAKTTITWAAAVRFGTFTLGSYPDLVVHAESTGGMAHVVMSYMEATPINTASYWPCEISNAGVVTIGTAQGLSPPYEMGGYTRGEHCFPSIALNPTTKRLGVLWGTGDGNAYVNRYGTHFSYADPCSVLFQYTGAEQTWVVPAGVNEITVELIGAAGGDGVAWTNMDAKGGKGERLTCRLPVTPGETLRFYVGGRGNNGKGSIAAASSNGAGGWNGGQGAGGGGASDIRRGGSALANRILIAAGGGGAVPTIPGGAVGSNGGDGGGLTGEDGDGNNGMGGKGATQVAGGAAGGGDGNNVQGTAGTLGQGGNGASYNFYANGEGGGGGGGLYGGGGGATNSTGTHSFYNGGGGGGGGSGYHDPSALDVVHERGIGTPSEYGLIKITYAAYTGFRKWGFVSERVVDKEKVAIHWAQAGNKIEWDGTAFIAAVGSLDRAKVYESADLFATAPTVRLDDTSITYSGVALGIDPSTRDIYAFYSHYTGNFYSEVRYRKFTRAAGTWGAPVTVHVGKTVFSNPSFLPNVRYGGGELRWIFTTGNASPYEVRSDFIAFVQTILPTGIASAEAFGNPTVAPGPVTLSPGSIPSEEAFGTPTLQRYIVLVPTGIASAEAFGNVTIYQAMIVSNAGGIASAEAFGNPIVVPGPVIISQAGGIASAEAFGVPYLAFTQFLSPTGIPSEEAVGTPTLTPFIVIVPEGIESEEAFGAPELIPSDVIISVVGIASAEAFGIPFIQPPGIPWIFIPISDLSLVVIEEPGIELIANTGDIALLPSSGWVEIARTSGRIEVVPVELHIELEENP
jgi:hypothetical protein